jgi:IS605 OrfB family transposase
MIKSYKLKIYANKEKLEHIEHMISQWTPLVNGFIEFFWQQNKFPGKFPPKEFRDRCSGNTLINRSSILAWNLVKTCKKLHRPKPIYSNSELPLHSNLFNYSTYTSDEFDFWFKFSSGNGRRHPRMMIPCKKTTIFNKALSTGILKQGSCKIWKSKNNIYYLIVYVEFQNNAKNNTNKLGIDVGHKNAIATSDGKFYGKDLWNLRIKTKHRNYKDKVTPSKQRLNFYAKQLYTNYPNTDFIVEQLNFSKKRKFGHKLYRSLISKWAYMHLANKLESIGQLKGFQVYKVNPFNTSRTCPKCQFIDKENRKGETFQCLQCDYKNHADTVSAVNILTKEYPVSSEHVKLLNHGL